MTALPTAPPQAQMTLFEVQVKPKRKQTAICTVCLNERPIGQFKWERKGVRSGLCNTCRFSPPDASKKSVAASAQRLDGGINDSVAATPQPAPLWAQRGDVVKLLILDERTGQVLCVIGKVTSVQEVSKLKMTYTKLRNFLVGRGWQIAQIRGSVITHLLDRVAQGTP